MFDFFDGFLVFVIVRVEINNHLIVVMILLFRGLFADSLDFGNFLRLGIFGGMAFSLLLMLFGVSLFFFSLR
jgi:hypothetical protein